MDDLDREATARQTVGYVLLGLVTIGWMAGLAFGFASAGGAGGSLVETTSQWLVPALQGVIGLAILSLAVVLTAIRSRIRIRARALSSALPRLLGS
jgi:hypothetical protein